MKFVVDIVSKCSGRLGTLSSSESGTKFQTPLLMQTTKVGSIPYLSKEVCDYLWNTEQILQISLNTTDHMEEALKVFKGGLAAFVGFPKYPIFLSFSDSCDVAPSGYNDKDVVPLFRRQGKLNLTADRYMDIVETFQPDMYPTLCDSDTNDESSKKRIQKSIDRTEDFLKICAQRHKDSLKLGKSSIIGSIVGGYSKEARLKSIQDIKNSIEVNGYIYEGFHNYGHTAIKVNIENLKEIVNSCQQNLEDNKFKIFFGAYNPLTILELVKLGIDIFDTSYVYIMTQHFRALTFDYNISQVQTSNLDFSLDLNDEKHKDDFTAILDGCKCLACEKHTKAYIHHLVRTRELLASILLMIHNLHHYSRFFDAIRSCIRDDTLDDLLCLIGKQSPQEMEIVVEQKSDKKEKKIKRN